MKKTVIRCGRVYIKFTAQKSQLRPRRIERLNFVVRSRSGHEAQANTMPSGDNGAKRTLHNLILNK